MRRGPDFIIIGAMKCATSTLHVQLAEQPGFFMTEPKEPNFFSDNEIWDRGLEWYEALYANAGDNDLCGESSTHYTKLPTYPDTVRRIADHTGAATRFIYVMRHPVDRLISHYVHEWSEGVISVPIDEAIDKHPELVSYGSYGEQLKPYLETFGRERLLPVFFDRLVCCPQEELERICSFIGYRGTPTWNEGTKEQNVSSQRLRSTRSLEFLKRLPGSEFFRRRLLPESIREGIKGYWKMERPPALSEASRSRLIDIFDSDLAILSEWLGIDVDCGNFKSVGRETAPTWKRTR